MKKRTVLTFIICAFAMLSVAQEYKISCVVKPEYSGKTVYLVNKNANDTIASCEVVDNAFVFEGDICCQAVLDVVVNRAKGMVATLLVEKGCNVSVDMTEHPIKINDNGGMNDKLTAMYAAAKECGAELGALAKKMRDEGKNEEEIMETLASETEALYDIYRNTIAENSDNMLGAYVLNLVARQFYTSVAELETIMSKVKFSGEFRALEKIRSALYYGEKTKAGKKFVDFSGYALGGEPSKLSDYVGKGKYVLIDFWASWCGPCKKEMPKVIEIDQKYTGDKFMVIGVNIGDNETDFKAAVPELGITYPQIFVPRNSKDVDNAVLLYNVETIPHMILISPDGTILERGLHGAELENKVQALLK